jgi:hypothetical protein
MLPLIYQDMVNLIEPFHQETSSKFMKFMGWERCAFDNWIF